MTVAVEMSARIAALEAEVARLSQHVCDECTDANGEPTGWRENRVEGRVPCVCVAETEPYIAMESALAEAQRERDEALKHAEVGRLLEELRGKVSGGPIEIRVSTRKTDALVRVGLTPWYGDTLAAALRKAREEVE